ncbi:hypothetical protein K502DRAFT_348218 [Neoconidiobolus thromboides FSU 785]|nr:hypothetical protein K502DRAFT_348218 [Neoconidiobolus thromboides FSU 785]
MPKQQVIPRKQKPSGILEINSRLPVKPSQTLEDIYITKKTKLKYLYLQVKKGLIEKRLPKLSLHGLGSCTLNTVQLALMLETQFEEFKPQLKITTDTTKVIEDLTPEDEEEDIETRVRNVSSIHIEIQFLKLP